MTDNIIINTPNPNSVTENTEIGRATEFAQRISKTHCYIDESDKWHIFNGNIWKEENKKFLHAEALEFFKENASEISIIEDERDRNDETREFQRHANRSSVNNLVELASCQLIKSIDDFDTDLNALAVESGWINLRDGRHFNPSPDMMFSKCTSVPYFKDAAAPLWRKTILQVFDGDKAMAEYFQRAVGYSLLGENKEQCLFICYGSGANGKSLLLETIKDVLGSYGQSMPIAALLRGKTSSGAANPEIARLLGVRFALAAEAEKGQHWSAHRVKMLTGNDTITARNLYKGIFEFKSQATIWIASNHKPEVDSSDEAMWRRIKLIPFNHVFSNDEQDPELTNKLKYEYAGILTWMVQGLCSYNATGLQEPKKVIDATMAYREEMNSVKRFIAEALELDNDSRETLSEVKETYKNWCKDECLQPLPSSQFKNALIDAGCKEAKSGSTRYWSGLRLINPLEKDFDNYGF